MEWWLRGVEQLWGDTPHPRAKEKSQQVGRRGKTTFGIKPHTCQRCPEGSNQPCAHQDPETPQRPRLRTVSGCLLRRCGSAVPSPRGRGSGCSRPGYGITLLEEVAINPIRESPELTQDWETDPWRAQTEPCAHQDPGEGAVAPQESDPDLPVSVQESPVQVWVSGGLLQGWGHWV